MVSSSYAKSSDEAIERFPEAILVLTVSTTHALDKIMDIVGLVRVDIWNESIESLRCTIDL